MLAPLFAQVLGGQYNLDAPGFALVAIAVTVTLGLIIGGAILYATLRRTPPIETEIDSKIKAAITSLEEKFEERIGGLSTEVHRLNSERRTTIGRLFDKLETLRSETDEKLERQQSTMAKGFEDMNRALGRIEGGLKK